MKRSISAVAAILVLALAWPRLQFTAHARPLQQPAPAMTAEELDRLVAPIALYPDQLLAQMLQCAQNAGNIDALNLWMNKNPNLKGSELQDAATNAGFEPPYVMLAMFPQVVKMMADQLDWTIRLGVAFTSQRAAVFDAIQRLRKRASDVGTLKTTPQQEVHTQTTSSGSEVIVIEPANPQVIYVPQYNTTTVYTQAPTTTTVIVESDHTDEAVAAGMIGFTAGIAMGAAFSNPYYYGPYGWHGGAYMYNDAWDDYYDAREDAREDWQDHREDIVDERGDRAENAREQRTERAENRGDTRSNTQEQRTERQQNRQANGGAQAQAASQRSGSGTTRPTAESRGYSQGGSDQRARQQSSRSSDAFSGYSSGKSERTASQRGQTSRSSSSRSRGGGGGRRR